MEAQETMEFILERLAHTEAVLAETAERQAKAEKLQARTDRRLDRAIRLAVEEARRERVRRREMYARLDDNITKLAAAQLVTEEKLQRFIDSRTGTNGRG